VKLVDNSIIQVNYIFDYHSNLIVHNLTYISGKFEMDDINGFAELVPDEEIEKLHDISGVEFVNAIITYNLVERFYVPETIINSILSLQLNPISFRFDLDKRILASEDHPQVHLTINNIESSRFFVDKELSISDFIIFILDLIYGIKPNIRQQHLVCGSLSF
jgi:hypothetical protein